MLSPTHHHPHDQLGACICSWYSTLLGRRRHVLLSSLTSLFSKTNWSPVVDYYAFRSFQRYLIWTFRTFWCNWGLRGLRPRDPGAGRAQILMYGRKQTFEWPFRCSDKKEGSKWRELSKVFIWLNLIGQKVVSRPIDVLCYWYLDFCVSAPK